MKKSRLVIVFVVISLILSLLLFGLAYLGVTDVGWSQAGSCPADTNIVCWPVQVSESDFYFVVKNTGDDYLLNLSIEIEGCWRPNDISSLAPNEKWTVRIKFKDCIEGFEITDSKTSHNVYATYWIGAQHVNKKLIGTK